jgi:3-isopropylmalate/(R)-2-methylmalate dehydratase small subunit
MSFEPINTIVSKVVPLRAENIDTDRIIPARFLKAVDSDGFGKNLFYDWRYLPDGTANPDFILNTPEGQGKILLTGKNFGCGSSREHAAWALYQYGFRAIISSGFADIFRTNALNNGLLPIEVSENQLRELFDLYQKGSANEWTVDIPSQTLCPCAPVPELGLGVCVKCGCGVPGAPLFFELNSFRKECLANGLDLIDFLAALKPEIEIYEQTR